MELHAIALGAPPVFTASDNLRLQGDRFCNLHFILNVTPEFPEHAVRPGSLLLQFEDGQTNKKSRV
jgi:hypothetical protein